MGRGLIGSKGGIVAEREQCARGRAVRTSKEAGGAAVSGRTQQQGGGAAGKKNSTVKRGGIGGERRGMQERGGAMHKPSEHETCHCTPHRAVAGVGREDGAAGSADTRGSRAVLRAGGAVGGVAIRASQCDGEQRVAFEQRGAVHWSQAAQSTQGGAVTSGPTHWMSGPTHWRLGRDQDGVEHQLKMGGWLDLAGVDMGCGAVDQRAAAHLGRVNGSWATVKRPGAARSWPWPVQSRWRGCTRPSQNHLQARAWPPWWRASRSRPARPTA